MKLITQMKTQILKNNYIIYLLKSILGGFSIGLGGLAYLSCDNKIVGALFFTVGLFTILVFNLNLFTGKLCYVIENKNYVEVTITLIGNFIGTAFIAILAQLCNLSIVDKAQAVVFNKMNNSYISLFVLAILCNIMIYIAVEGFKRKGIIGIVALFFGVSVFIICGFEHCVADMFYFNYVQMYSADAFLRLFIIILGNIVGGVFIRFIHKNLVENIN